MPDVNLGRLPFKSAIEFLRDKGVVPTESYTDLLHQEHDNAFVIAGMTKADVLEDVKKSLVKAMQEGIPFEQWKRKEFLPAIEGRWLPIDKRTGEVNAGWRARVIYGTNLRTAYAAGRYQQLQRMKDAFPFWRYRHGGSRDPRPDHLSWDGLTLKADNPWWDTHYPPNGWGCSCYVEPVSDVEMEDLGKVGEDGRPKADDTPPEAVRKVTYGGREIEVPKGVDPGWAYVPGKSLDPASGAKGRTPDAGESNAPLFPAAPNASPDKVGMAEKRMEGASPEFAARLREEMGPRKEDEDAGLTSYRRVAGKETEAKPEQEAEWKAKAVNGPSEPPEMPAKVRAALDAAKAKAEAKAKEKAEADAKAKEEAERAAAIRESTQRFQNVADTAMTIERKKWLGQDYSKEVKGFPHGEAWVRGTVGKGLMTKTAKAAKDVADDAAGKAKAIAASATATAKEKKKAAEFAAAAEKRYHDALALPQRDPAIEVTAGDMLHGNSKKHLAGNVAVPPGAYLDMHQILASPKAILYDKRTGALLYAFDVPTPGMHGVLVVQPGVEQKTQVKGKTVTRALNKVKTAHIKKTIALRDPMRYTTLEGSL